MKPVVLCFCFMLCIYLPRMEQQELPYTPMEALDIVREKYAANFIRQESAEDENYFYQLPDAEYYLVYEGQGATEDEYIIHLYEFVTEDPVENIGHTVTYGWYRVDRNTGEITEYEK